jgi:hypothetical protein
MDKHGTVERIRTEPIRTEPGSRVFCAGLCTARNHKCGSFTARRQQGMANETALSSARSLEDEHQLVYWYMK